MTVTWIGKKKNTLLQCMWFGEGSNKLKIQEFSVGSLVKLPPRSKK